MRDLSRERQFPSQGHPGAGGTMVRECLGVDLESVCRISRLHARCRRNRRVQRQIHVQSVCAPRRLVRDPGEPHPRDLPEFLSSLRALAIHGHKARQMIARELVAVPSYAREVVDGLSARPKTLPCKLFYDDRGSALFEEITRLPEYYLTRTELEILQESSRE